MRDAGPRPEHLDLRKEAYTMAIYVAVSLLAAVTVLGHEPGVHRRGALPVIWGTSLGLALIHWLAYRLAATLVQGRPNRHDATAGAAQISAAVLVAALATLPVLIAPRAYELAAVQYVIVGAIGVAGYLFARNAGARRFRALVVAGGMVLVTATAALLKNLLSGH